MNPNSIKMKFLLITLCVLSTAGSPLKSLREEWALFKEKYQTNYQSFGEEEKRFNIFKDNFLTIAEHNARFDNGQVTYTMDINEFAALTSDEMKQRKNGLISDNHHQISTSIEHRISGNIFDSFGTKDLPSFIDWRERGAVTPIKNMHQCHACYVFSAIAAIESHYFIKNKKTISLSEQNVLDCARPQGTSGCYGGVPFFVYDYIIINGGIATEESYPYRAKEEECKYNETIKGATMKSYVRLPYEDEKAIQEVVATIGPVSVCVDSHSDNFTYYKSGVYKVPDCNPPNVDHCLLAVGYGTDENGVDYWILKNSWGAHWGDKGYIKMARNANNHCGIATWASYPIV